MDPIAITGLLVAAIRAEETKRPDRLFDDPFAAALAGEQGPAALALYRAAAAQPIVPVIEVRTRWYDDALARCAADGTRQFVFLAAGMDSRAYRLAWPAGTRVFEVDQPEVIAAKARVLADAVPRCTRIAIGLDLASEWRPQLEADGFDRSAQTTWIVEGLLQYLDRAKVQQLFTRIDALCLPGTVLLYDVVGQSMLDAPQLAGAMRMMRELGAPWTFGSDEPATLLSEPWQTTVTEPAIVGNAWQRWPFPAAPPGVPGVPRGYLVHAIKR